MNIDKNNENKISGLAELYLDSNDLDITRLARVYRKSKELGLSRELEDKLVSSSFSSYKNVQTPNSFTDRNYLDFNSNLNLDSDKSVNIINENESESEYINKNKNKNKNKNIKEKQSFDLKQYQLKIRQLVYLEKNWEDIKLYAWPIFRYKKSDRTAADLIEYSFLYGSIQDVLEVIDILELEFGSKSYYEHVHEAIRTQLLLVLWKNNLDQSIKNLITESLDIEKLYKLSCYLKEEDSSTLFSYFMNNKESILQALDKYSNFLNIKKGFILCKIARIAISLKKYQEATYILRQVDNLDPNYIEAIELLINTSTISLDPEDKKYLAPILSEPRWTIRMELIEKLMSTLNTTTDEFGFNKFLTTKTLTIFFTNPYKYIPNNFQSNIVLIGLISKYFNLHTKILSLFNVLKILTPDFNNIEISKTIWDFIEKNWNDSSISLKKYWYAVAYTHLFYLRLRIEDKIFYQSRNELEKVKLNFTTPYSWNEIHSFMCSSISSLDIDEKHKNKMQQILRLVSSNFSYINTKDVSNYLDNLQDLPPDILSSFQTLLQKHSDFVGELKLIKYRMNLYGVSINDLKRIWALSSYLDKTDLAWRVATVLKYKNELNIEIEKIWRLSGENRANYPIIQLDNNDIDKIISSFKKDSSSFLSSFMNLGKNLEELFLILDTSFTKFKLDYKNKIDPRFKDIFLGLKNIDNKYYIDLKEKTVDKNSDNNDNEFYTVSSLYNIISKRLFSFMLEKDFDLRSKKINALLPKLANDITLEKESKQLFNWLKHLSSNQRLSWSQFCNYLKNKNINEIQTEIISFIYKMIIVIYPNHLATLNYLGSICKDKKDNSRDHLYEKVQDECIRWILSDKYFSLREKYKLSSQTPISKTLKNL